MVTGDRPADPPAGDADVLSAELERVLLGDSMRYTRRDLAERSGVPVEEGRRLWRAMGFAEVADDDAVFTDGDLEALRTATDLLRDGLLDAGSLVALTRALGQSMARLAEAELEQLEAALDVGLDRDGAARLAREVLPKVQQLVVYVWRRQLAAAATRRLAADVDQHQLVVCFADMSGFTGISRELPDLELAQLIESFEAVAADLVAAAGGRVVKTVGDEVLFVAARPEAAAEAALRLVDAAEDDSVLPPVRAGLAYGTVLSRIGDVYGTVVNLASRLTSVARPGSVLVDLRMADALAADGRFQLHRTPRFAVRGFPHLQPTRLRWAEDSAPARSGEASPAG